jgi:argininosuccinate lyase
MKKNAVVFVSTNTTGTGITFIESTIRRGLVPVLLSKDPALPAWATALGIEVVHANINDVDTLIDICYELAARYSLAAITSTANASVEIAARVARHFGLAAPDPEPLARAADKHIQREVFACHDVPSPMWRAVEYVDEAVAALEWLGNCAVIKPLRGSGSIGARLVQNDTEIVTHAKELFSGAITGRREATVLIEEYVDGAQFSVESFFGATVGITRNHIGPVPFFVETGHDFPAALERDEHDRIIDAASRAVAALDLGWGPAHVELRIGRRGPVVIEVNARLAGGMIPELIRLARGIDLVNATLSAWLGEPANLVATRDAAASLRAVLAGRRGVMREVRRPTNFPKDVRWMPVRHAGDVAGGFGDFRDRVGYVIAEGATVEASSRIAAAAAKTIDVLLEEDVPEEVAR